MTIQKIIPTILIVDDDESIRDVLHNVLNKKYNTILVSTAEKALQILQTTHVNVMLLDLKLPGMSGEEFLEKTKDTFNDLDIVVITAVKEIESAVKIMKYGVYDYITKDFNITDVSNIVGKIIKKQNECKEILYLKSEIKQYTEMGFVVGESPEMYKICDLVRKIGKIQTNVLLQGESGTGKELVARSIHRSSKKPDSPFIAVNIASVPDGLMESFLFGHEKGAFTGAHRQHYGKFELANNGTLFLDEIGDLKYNLQVKLLRVIQEGEFERVGGTQPITVNVRLIAASNNNLEHLVAKGEFREDLFYRINIIPIKLPPLRERKEDIVTLVKHFLNKYSKKFHKDIKGISEKALNILQNYYWPGNIRELENLIERLVAITDKTIISQTDIPIEYQLFEMKSNYHNDFDQANYLRMACDKFEKTFILKELEKVNWSRKEAAKKLGIPISTLKYKLKKQNLYKVLDGKN